jgi:hypothetical protein
VYLRWWDTHLPDLLHLYWYAALIPRPKNSSPSSTTAKPHQVTRPSSHHHGRYRDCSVDRVWLSCGRARAHPPVRRGGVRQTDAAGTVGCLSEGEGSPPRSAQGYRDARKRTRAWIWRCFRGPVREWKYEELDAEHAEQLRADEERHAEFIVGLQEKIRDSRLDSNQ